MGHSWRSRVGWRLLGLALGAVIGGTLIIALTVLPSTPNQGALPTTFYPFTGFGGYHLNTTVSQISAQWRVPTIAKSSPTGWAATWVGADEYNFSNFVQIGTFEASIGPGSPPQYEEFWSDSAVGYHPHRLALVHAGDLVAVSMVQSTRGWTIRAHDLTTRSRRVITLAVGIGHTYAHAEWVQEDPAPNGVTSRDLPYPTMTTVTFAKVRVNFGVPMLALENAGALFPNGGPILVPTPLLYDSFGFVHPEGAKLQYLEDARTVDAKVALFQSNLVHWYSLSLAQRQRSAERMQKAFSHFASSLTTQQWPAIARDAVNRAAQGARVEAHFFASWQHQGLTFTDAVLRRISQITTRGHALSAEVRQLLLLPPT